MIRIGLKRLFSRVARPFFPKYIIVAVDGGICSQIAQYILSRVVFEETGTKVFFDFAFFKKHGKDLNGVFERRLSLDKLFADMDLKEPDDKLNRFYFRFFRIVGESDTDIQRIKAPVYLGGYYDLDKYIYLQGYLNKYTKFRPESEILDAPNLCVLQRIRACKVSVGVHVRRGDMAKTIEHGYWQVASPSYFLHAMKIDAFCKATFFFFSDEADWVEENIITELDGKVTYEIVKVNGSGEGYRDLYLMSQCTHQICSQGSMGKFAFMYNTHPDKSLVCPIQSENDVWLSICHTLGAYTLGYNGEKLDV